MSLAIDLLGATTVGASYAPAPALADVAAGNGVIKKGMSGLSVTYVQKVVGASEVDGQFGPATEKKVKAYQKDKGLSVDGVVGQSTVAAMGVTGPVSAKLAELAAQTNQAASTPTTPVDAKAQAGSAQVQAQGIAQVSAATPTVSPSTQQKVADAQAAAQKAVDDPTPANVKDAKDKAAQAATSLSTDAGVAAVVDESELKDRWLVAGALAAAVAGLALVYFSGGR